MPPVLVLLLIASGVVTGIVILIAWAGRHSERAYRNFESLAGQLGLRPKSVKPTLGRFWPEGEASGELRGRPARLFGYATGSGKTRVTWSALAIQPRATGGLTFSLTRQDLGSKISELFGAREIAVGDPAFDAAWFIRTNRPEFFSAALIPELRARLTAALGNPRDARRLSFKLEHDSVVYSEAGDFSQVARCNRIARLAEVVSELADVAEVCAEQSNRGAS
jgi:hypothetical protein